MWDGVQERMDGVKVEIGCGFIGLKIGGGKEE